MRLDINGARYAWMGVNLLPFIDRKRLLHAMSKLNHKLSEHEVEMNKRGEICIFMEKIDKGELSGLMQALNQIDVSKVKAVELMPCFKRGD